MRYENLDEQEETLWTKISRSSYLIISISLLTHTFCLIYSLITYKRQSAAFISIIVSATSCFFISSSHLTIYGISILGTLYLSMVQAYFSAHQMFYIVALSGIFMLALWRPIHSLGSIFKCLPGKVHASLVFGIVLIVLSRFFPLAIENMDAFFMMSEEQFTSSPFKVLNLLFESFNMVTLIITIVLLILMFILRKRLEKIPLIGIMVIIGILANLKHPFKSYSDLCAMQNVNCTFLIIDPSNIKQPQLSEIIEVIPTAIVMTIVIIFEQFLYLEEFERRGSRFRNEGTLGQIKTQTKVLAVANLISGVLGGLPICINIFGTYENFAFNKSNGFKGTKWVGLLQIPFSLLLYTLADYLFKMIPMFVLFIIVATPVIYFIRNVLMYHWSHLHTILIIALICVFTHPIIALIFACFISIYEISELLKPAPAEMMIEGRQSGSSKLSRRSELKAVTVEKNPDADTRHLNQFQNKIVSIDEDIPEEYRTRQYVIYRLIGSISFMNFPQHLKAINNTIDQHCRNNRHPPLLLSFRYSQIIDNESITEIAYLSEYLEQQEVKVIFTGLHGKVVDQMKELAYFSKIIREEEHGEQRMYKIIT